MEAVSDATLGWEPVDPPFTRSIAIDSSEGAVRVAIVDDFHHFRVTVKHRDGVIAAAQSQTLRAPFSLCPSAASRLDELVGRPVDTDIFALMRAIDARQQCTHQFDMALLGIAAAQRGHGRRTYHASLACIGDEELLANLDRDGRSVLTWRISGNLAFASDDANGIDLVRGFTASVAGMADPQDREDAIILRRAWFVARGRGPVGRALTRAPTWGGCWVQWPDRAQHAERTGDLLPADSGSRAVRDDDDAWLNGCDAEEPYRLRSAG